MSKGNELQNVERAGTMERGNFKKDKSRPGDIRVRTPGHYFQNKSPQGIRMLWFENRHQRAFSLDSWTLATLPFGYISLSQKIFVSFISCSFPCLLRMIAFQILPWASFVNANLLRDVDGGFCS